MLMRRIIPCLDVNDGRVVKGIRVQNLAMPAATNLSPPATKPRARMNSLCSM